MSKFKMLKLPKKPKANASMGVMERYLAKVKAIKSENVKRAKLNKRLDDLKKTISGISAAYVTPNRFSAVSTPKKRKTATKRKTTSKRKRTTRKRR